ncbi:MAG TPA: DNA-processing protein DprA [Usitatibacter sp.]|nr:DNA-processing protein DprA [Usitatibacter sp.]
MLTDTPLLQPDFLPWLRLTLVPRVAPRLQLRLLRLYQSPQDIFAASSAELARHVGASVAEALTSGPAPRVLDAATRWLQQPHHHLLALGDPRYPQSLLNIADPPIVLYVSGRIELLDAPSIAIVGSRNATPRGIRDAEEFAFALSEAGLCVVSGMALGIDAAAHRGALAGRGSSVAVLGTGPDIIYPRRNEDLANELARIGALLTEFPPGSPAVAGNFPRRNRLISGLSRGVLVVEAAQSSGSLITAREAADQGRDVFAIPGSIHSPLSKGCHELIRQGAKLVEKAEDVLAELGWDGNLPPAPASEGMSPAEELLAVIPHQPVCLDQLAEDTGLPAASIAARLSQLEVEGRIVALPGGWFQRAGH